MRRSRMRGFTLVELLLVLAILAIISSIAIPAFSGQRMRARVIGDAKTNAKVLAMVLESYKAEQGTYPATGTYSWLNGTANSSNPSTIPAFTPPNSSPLQFVLVIDTNLTTYTITVIYPNKGPNNANLNLYQVNQSGNETVYPNTVNDPPTPK